MASQKTVRDIIKNIQSIRKQPFSENRIQRINKIFEKEIEHEKAKKENAHYRRNL